MQRYTEDRILNMIRQCVPIPQKIYKITKRLKTPPEEVEKYFPGFLAFIDSTERQIPLPTDNKRKKIFYSGKKKRHTIKNQLTVNKDGYILHKIAYKKGKRHDYIFNMLCCMIIKISYFNICFV